MLSCWSKRLIRRKLVNIINADLCPNGVPSQSYEFFHILVDYMMAGWAYMFYEMEYMKGCKLVDILVDILDSK